jgi:hypothetical protein
MLIFPLLQMQIKFLGMAIWEWAVLVWYCDARLLIVDTKEVTGDRSVEIVLKVIQMSLSNQTFSIICSVRGDQDPGGLWQNLSSQEFYVRGLGFRVDN